MGQSVEGRCTWISATAEDRELKDGTDKFISVKMINF